MTDLSNKPQCTWCDELFTPRGTGGRAQKFCKPRCRQSYHTAGRAFVKTAVENGSLSVSDLKMAHTTCTLAGEQ